MLILAAIIATIFILEMLLNAYQFTLAMSVETAAIRCASE
jgi:hypothetical protein